jgi:hypothetical protein
MKGGRKIEVASILSMDGRMVLIKRQINTENIELDISGLAQGSYIVLIQSESSVSSRVLHKE